MEDNCARSSAIILIHGHRATSAQRNKRKRTDQDLNPHFSPAARFVWDQGIRRRIDPK